MRARRGDATPQRIADVGPLEIARAASPLSSAGKSASLHPGFQVVTHSASHKSGMRTALIAYAQQGAKE
jgi:hypothetical protein